MEIHRPGIIYAVAQLVIGAVLVVLAVTLADADALLHVGELLLGSAVGSAFVPNAVRKPQLEVVE